MLNFQKAIVKYLARLLKGKMPYCFVGTEIIDQSAMRFESILSCLSSVL